MVRPRPEVGFRRAWAWHCSIGNGAEEGHGGGARRRAGEGRREPGGNRCEAASCKPGRNLRGRSLAPSRSGALQRALVGWSPVFSLGRELIARSPVLSLGEAAGFLCVCGVRGASHAGWVGGEAGLAAVGGRCRALALGGVQRDRANWPKEREAGFDGFRAAAVDEVAPGERMAAVSGRREMAAGRLSSEAPGRKTVRALALGARCSARRPPTAGALTSCMATERTGA